MKTFLVGVTGVIASGKSTACRYFQDERGFVWLDADHITHELYQKGGQGYTKIKEYFGDYYVGKTEVHRNRLRALVAKNHQKMWILNKVIHPIIWNEVSKKIDQLKAQYKREQRDLKVCLEAFYLEPGDVGTFCDRILCIDAPNDRILQRLKERGLPADEAKEILTFQRKIQPKNFTEVIMNDTSPEAFKSKLSTL
ncbi:dephospho-CoA kinase [Candidatus Gracilibacteria bacterium]|nr:dephospho-CoA kinase [Candidatus Gracilibacteria bacterium]